MRLRNVPGAREVMIENEYVFTEPEGMKGTWSQVFGNDNPIRIEIGMGKGTFITTLAANNPDINYVGIEKYSSVLLRAVEKQDELQLPNLRFIRIVIFLIPMPVVLNRELLSEIWFVISIPASLLR